MIDKDALPYRPCAGVMILNSEGKVLVGQRFDSVVEAWQMPQGGIDPGEDPLETAYRELWEETGIERHLVELVAEAPEELFYDLPDELIGRIWKGKWRGQRQRWFLFRFLGTDSDVNIATPEPEFRDWRWATPAELPELIVPFKRELYQRLLVLFSPYL